MRDIVRSLLAIVLLILVSPILIITCLLIVLFEFDTPFFAQQRIGVDRKPFTIFKLRSMKNGKVTFLGRIIRKTGIDELPQLINILKSDLNFIGPRPLTEFDIERLNWTTAFYDYRWTIKPGLTGLAQLSPICHQKNTVFWDRYYLENQSLLLDAKIITASALIPLLGKKKVKQFILLRK